MRKYRFHSVPKGGRKGSKGQTKAIRNGAVNPGGSYQGSIRRPF